MNDDIWEYGRCPDFTIERIARRKIEAFRIGAMPAVLTVGVKVQVVLLRRYDDGTLLRRVLWQDNEHPL